MVYHSRRCSMSIQDGACVCVCVCVILPLDASDFWRTGILVLILMKMKTKHPMATTQTVENPGYQSTAIAGSRYCGPCIVLWLWGRWLAVRPFLRASGEAGACAGRLCQWCLLQDADVSFALSLALARCRVCLSCSACGSSACSAVRCLAFGLTTGPPVMRHLRLR